MLENVNIKEGTTMLFLDGEVHQAVYNESFYNNMMFKYSMKQLNSDVVKTVFEPTHNHNGHECMVYDSWSTFQSEYGSMVLEKANTMLKSIGMKEHTCH